MHTLTIISTKISGIEPDLVFQISFKTINNSIGLNKLIFTLLISSIYSKMTKLDTLFPSITQCIMTMRKAVCKVQKCIASQQINNVFSICNRLSIISLYNLSINLPVLIY